MSMVTNKLIGTLSNIKFGRTPSSINENNTATVLLGLKLINHCFAQFSNNNKIMV